MGWFNNQLLNSKLRYNDINVSTFIGCAIIIMLSFLCYHLTKSLLLNTPYAVQYDTKLTALTKEIKVKPFLTECILKNNLNKE